MSDDDRVAARLSPGFSVLPTQGGVVAAESFFRLDDDECLLYPVGADELRCGRALHARRPELCPTRQSGK